MKERKGYTKIEQKSYHNTREYDKDDEAIKIKSLIPKVNNNSNEAIGIQIKERQGGKDFRSIILKNHLIIQQLKFKLIGNPSKSAEIMFKVTYAFL